MNMMIIDAEQKARVLKLIDDSKLSDDTKRLARDAIQCFQTYKSAHAQLFFKCQQLEREIEALRELPRDPS
jgi:hypothetical protein